jgi:hypothetical protein
MGDGSARLHEKGADLRHRNGQGRMPGGRLAHDRLRSYGNEAIAFLASADVATFSRSRSPVRDRTTHSRSRRSVRSRAGWQRCEWRFDLSVAWLDEQFAKAHDGPTVVVTHFAPARGSIAARFAGSPLNACFVSDLEERIRAWQPRLWLHGHVHDSFDYRIGATRIVANPRGYAPNGVIENASFDPGLVIEID